MMNWSYGKSRFSADHPVAIHPDVARLVFFETVGVGITGRVEPVPAPALAIVWRSQQPFDLALVSAGGAVRQKSVDVGDRGRQPDEIQAQAAQERCPVGRVGRRQTKTLQPGQHEAIDVIGDPRGVLDFGNNRTRWRTKCPVRARIFLDLAGALGPGGALIDPILHALDFGRRQRLGLGGHARDFLGRAGQRRPQPTFAALAGHDVLPQLAAGQRAGPLVEPQTGLLLLRAVAGVAMLFEKWLDIAGEVDLGFGRANRNRTQAARQCNRRQGSQLARDFRHG